MVTETAFTNMTVALAHEIKNPVSLALAHVALLRTADNANETENSLYHIERAMESIINLSQEMLSVTRGAPLAFNFDLFDVLTDVVDMYRAARPNAAFHLTPPPTPLTLRAPEVYLRIVLSNLIKNAVETNCRDVSVVLEKKEGCAFVVIRDNGPGFDNEYGQIQNPKPYGNGLGLSIARWLLERMEGNLTLRPAPLGGCEAVVRLPYTNIT
ncbi:MAG: HAMP domain-containing histidine kinase [Defluviitaleaceae bacterium]|nr:HAMP domain-containing histidine kinase [Defluviitaleaceae bacterium]